jgi:hypothetical protein
MTDRIFADLNASLTEAVDIKKGLLKPAKITRYTDISGKVIAELNDRSTKCHLKGNVL